MRQWWPVQSYWMTTSESATSPIRNWEIRLGGCRFRKLFCSGVCTDAATPAISKITPQGLQRADVGTWDIHFSAAAAERRLARPSHFQPLLNKMRTGRLHGCTHGPAAHMRSPIRRKASPPEIGLGAFIPSHRAWKSLFRSTCLISGLELPPLVAFLEERGPLLEGFSIWLHMDSDNSLAAMPRGYSNTALVAVLVSRDWEIIRRFPIRIGFSRVPPEENPADLTTRRRRMPYHSRRIAGFSAVGALSRRCRNAPEKANPPRISRIPLNKMMMKARTR